MRDEKQLAREELKEALLNFAILWPDPESEIQTIWIEIREEFRRKVDAQEDPRRWVH